MKQTFTRTMTIANLETAKVKILVYHNCKYTHSDLGETTEFEYTGLTSWDIIEGGEDAFNIEYHQDIMDEFHEYLVLHFKDGMVITIRNSHCDMFIK